MKCVDCGKEIEMKTAMNSLGVTLDNPGHVSTEGNTILCKHCGSHYASGSESRGIIARLEQERIKQDKA